MRVGEVVRLRVRALAFGGDAVADGPDGRVVFLAGGVPGDEVEARLDEVKRKHAHASLLRVVAPSGARVQAPCSLAGRCGGCQWQEVSEQAQRYSKHATVERALGRLGFEVLPLVTPAPPLGYRSRVRMHAASGGRLGFQGRRSNEVVDVEHCPALEPALDQAMAAARKALAGSLPAGASVAGLVGSEGAVQLAIAGSSADRRLHAATTSLIGTAGITGVLLDDTAIGDRTLVIDPGDGTGREPPFRAAADGFSQATHEGNRALRSIVAEQLPGFYDRALELYSGDGNLTRHLARVSREVIAVEGDAGAIERLVGNVVGSGVRGIAEPVERVTDRLLREGERFDVVLLDPPRAGAAEVAARLAALTPRVVYVSCDPMTLARDAAILRDCGLRPVRATPIDLMPQTYHVETVCVFERREP